MASGKQDALRIITQRYGYAVTAVAERILIDKGDAEEVAADVLWQAWRDASRFDRSRGSVGTWLMMLARSRAIDRLRARKAREQPDDADPADIADAAGAVEVLEPSFEFHTAERRREVKVALEALKNGERELLDLAYFSDLTQSEIAERTGLALGTVKSRMRSGLARLRDALRGRIG
jgi:RNA polymerase sigma-70 factor (ECF subfamily)